MEKKAYAVYNMLDNVLSFYCDELLQHRNKYGVIIFETIENAGWRAYAREIEKVVFDDSFAEYYGVESTMKWFMDCENLKEIVGVKNLKTDNVVNMSGMFWNCSSLVSLDLSTFNTEKVHSMGWMFSGCTELSKLDVSSFNTKNVTFMGDMFSFCVSLEKLDLSNFNTDKVENMVGMFNCCLLLVDLDISSFNTKDDKIMHDMFLGTPLYVDWAIEKSSISEFKLKKAIYACCCGVEEEDKPEFDEEAIVPEYLPVWQAFLKSNFDLNKFMHEKVYEEIEDEDLRIEVIMGTVFPIISRPIARFAIDWLNGYLDFFKRESQELTDTEVLLKLYDCTNEIDLWRFMATGVGGIESLYRWYKGEYDLAFEEATGVPCYCEKDEEKAARFLGFFLKRSTYATDAVRKEVIKLKTN